MGSIFQLLQYDPQYTRLVETILAGKRMIYLHGIVQESTGHLVVSLLKHLKRPVFLVVESQKRARTLLEECNAVEEGAALEFPAADVQYFKTDSTISPLQRKRLAVMDRLYSGKPCVVITTLSALKRPVTPPRRYAEQAFRLRADEEADPETLAQKLLKMQYERQVTVERPGEFALRGDILDVFSPAMSRPVRIEFFDTEIDRMRFFDVETQRSTDPLEEVIFSPAEEMLFTAQDREMVLSGLEKDLEYIKKHPKFGQDAQRAREKFLRMQEDIRAYDRIANPDLAAGYLPEDALGALYDYLPDEGLILVEDIDRIVDAEKSREEQEAETRSVLLDQGELLRSHASPVRTYSDVLLDLRAYTMVNFTQILKTARLYKPDALLQIKTLEAERFHQRWDDFVERIRLRLRQNYRILLAAGPGRDALAAQLQESGVPFTIETAESGEDALQEGRLLLTSDAPLFGYRLPDSNLLLLTRTEVFGVEKRIRKPSRVRKQSDLLHYQDLEVGDFVVHEVYGIGEYLGTDTIEYEGLVKDFIKISYRGTDALYVPTDEMDMVTKYIGSGGPKPRISSLGGAEWRKSKERAKKAVDAIAEDLLELYAKRSKIEGYAFSPDPPWQKEFEDAFPYTDTPSQERATQEIKEDMERPKPMDRLLCGDVGYGKTEVALRASFKAVLDGKQVALLAPTTILVQQHYQTMMERFQKFPVRIEFLSRFKTPERQKAVIRDLKEGKVDILVGTHRLLSKDIRFKDLGLLIVDEEQRFGVKDKEKMKKLKEDVDVLTLSATPIPRTLQLSLTGIRDMSLLEEPPEERYPTISYVMEMDPAVIREAITRELDRGGQVYYVHNRVHDIHSVAERIQKLVPEARILVAHGKMSIRELEDVMERFVIGEADILLATTIIETGMDIPNVNTLIVQHADRMGLSQLYQLKGRVGRSDRQSYAYFTYDASKVLSELSEKRLKAIRDFTEFGSGYKIAMRDLELRGAGNLLGESQSGHIESIGYELYVRMLEEAVSRAKGQVQPERVQGIPVDFKISAYIPDEYIPQTSDKIMMYRQIASIVSEEDFNRITEELIDRYGDPPQSVVVLMRIVQIKRLATELGFSAIKETLQAVELRYENFDLFPVEMLKAISEGYRGPLSFDFSGEPKFRIERTPKKVQDTLNLLLLMKKVEGIRESQGGNDEE